ncbi:uncharacterized protein TNCV_2910191 [Trichonephila clavipes]|nr:uncharacterized protein TNCV_2910191 [Trichonephila clavipes]
MITNFFIPELNNHDVQELWFQQDGATCHTARATIDLLKDTFGDRLISRFGPVNWPPRSCDLTPLDYFLWGYVKSLVYADKPQTLDHLEDNIRRVIADIRPQMLEKVIENWTSSLDYNRASRGSPMPEIIFKMKRPELGSDGWLLLQDNALAHTALSVKQFMTSKNITVMGRPPYSSNLSPCDFSLFPTVKSCLKATHFTRFEEVQIMMLLRQSRERDETRFLASGHESSWDIGSRVGRNQTTIMRICDRWMQEGMTDRRGRSHPPQCTTSREDRQIVRMAVTDRLVTYHEP